MTTTNGYSRRTFLKVLGAGTGLAATGCAEELPEKLIPYVVQPDEVIPGVATWYAASCFECPAGCGMLVRTREGRAVKVEGNPDHPIGMGSLCTHGQSSVQAHYDPDRVREPLQRDPTGSFKAISWKDAIDQSANALSGSTGKRALLITGPLSGSIVPLIGELKAVVPNLEHLEFDFSGREVLRRAAQLTFGPGVTTHYDLSKASVLVNFGADFLESWVSPVEFSRQWSVARRPGEGMMYFAHIEPRLSLTAGNSDRWVKNAPASELRLLTALLAAVAEERTKAGAVVSDTVRTAIGQRSVSSLVSDTGVGEDVIRDLARRLSAAPTSLVLAGGAACSANAVSCAVVANLLNSLLGNVGKTVLVRPAANAPAAGSYEQLAQLFKQMEEGTTNVGTIIFSGVNPAYVLPEKTGFGKALSKSDVVITIGSHLDETATASNLVLPLSSSLESWLDAEPAPGVWNLNQPSMAPLYQTQSLGDTLLAIGIKMKPDFAGVASFQEYIQAQWKTRTANQPGVFEARWTNAVEKGGSWPEAARIPTVAVASAAGTFVQQALSAAPTKGLKLLVFPSVNSFDGRAANRPWLQELPNPITSSVWGSWVELHPETALKFGLNAGDVAQVRTPQGTVESPVFITKFIHPDVVAMPLGHGHTAYGRYAEAVGANALSVAQPAASEGNISLLVPLGDVQIPLHPALSTEKLVKVHFHDSQEGRGISRTVGLREFLKSPTAVAATLADVHTVGPHAAHGHRAGEGGHGASHKESGAASHEGGHGGAHADPTKALGPQPAPKQMYEQMDHPLYQWGMNIDLASCTGCSACVVACYAENNIPVVGKEIAGQGREMSWIRVERYFDEHDDQPVSAFMPVMCQHCQNAPCEPVCPVYATYHNEEGVNTMVYNRCVGTRYCSNNCSYKVRRFNWFKYNWPEPLTWQLNPDVTVREVGIMEKCTFCIQRINEAKNRAKDLGRPVLDGEVQPACAATCPTRAITFGNLLDRESAVSQKARSNRSYKVLDQFINTQPSVSYLARVRHDSPTKA